jgi:hypothetical protein
MVKIVPHFGHFTVVSFDPLAQPEPNIARMPRKINQFLNPDASYTFSMVSYPGGNNVEPYNKKPTYCQEKKSGVNPNDFSGGHPPCSPFFAGVRISEGWSQHPMMVLM